jgi:hypothetical protein
MNTSRKHFFALVGFMVIIGALMFLCSDAVMGQDEELSQSPDKWLPPAVPTKVVNTPLPIRGKVRITNKPTVQVESTPDKPLWVQNVSEGSHQIFQEYVSGEISGTTGSVEIPIPADKLLVIEYISGKADLPSGQRCYLQLIQEGAEYSSHFIPLTSHGVLGTRELHFASQEIRMYGGLGGGPFGVAVSRNLTSGIGYFDVSLSGYLVDIPK